MDSDCIACSIRQALDMCRFVDAEENTRQQVLQSVMEILIRRDEIKPEGEISFLIQNEIKRLLDLNDPYKSIKDESIRSALAIFPKLKEIVQASENPFKTAVEICIAGNVIDFGPSNSFNIEESINEAITSKKHRFDLDSFSTELKKAGSILMLADNAGETVFDRVLIDEIDTLVIYAVKSEPVMNDAILEDAIASGLEEYVQIIENGSPYSGTALSKCSPEFLDIYSSVDMVISKGQANFETLIDAKRRIFFLLKIKCEYLSDKHGIPLNEYVLLDNYL